MKSHRKMNAEVTTLILGFLSCVMFGALSGIPAVVFGHIALRNLKNEPAMEKRRRIVIAGIVLGYLGIIITIIVIFGFISLT